MKVLVTGSSGHLGEALVRFLRQLDGFEPIGTDIVASQFTDIVGNIADPCHARRCMVNVDAVLHTATLHKPHIVSHSNTDFVETNITGTLNLLEAAVASNVKSFVFTSSTSVFGDALISSDSSGPAVWINEDVVPIPKNVYGVTKLSAENLCEMFYRNHRLPCMVLRVSRFFPEGDDCDERREAYEDANLKASEFTYRRVDIEDVVTAHMLAIQKAPVLGFARFVISAPTPFARSDIYELAKNAPNVLKRIVPTYAEEYDRRKWRYLPTLDRVYDSSRAVSALDWRPRHTFSSVIERLQKGEQLLSPTAHIIGKKGYSNIEIEIQWLDNN
eukprot:CFRG6106T1